MRKYVFFAFLLSVASLWAQKPQWVGNTPSELNPTYKFVEIVSYGSTLETARATAKEQLTDDEQLQEGVRVYRKTNHKTTIDKQRTNGGALQETKRDHITVDMTIDGEKYDLQAIRVDEYADFHSSGVTLHTLYMVAVCDNPVFDRTSLTTRYGAKPVFMSIIPGLGQWYKGSRVKGSCMFAAEAAAVAGILVCENQRTENTKKMREQPKFTAHYSDKADQWERGRNICIGVAAGVWVYNIVDAIAAKGARRVVVRRADGGGMALQPFATPDAAGVSLAYSF